MGVVYMRVLVVQKRVPTYELYSKIAVATFRVMLLSLSSISECAHSLSAFELKLFSNLLVTMRHQSTQH